MALSTDHSRFVFVPFLTSLLFVVFVFISRFYANAESSEIRCKGEERQALLEIEDHLDDPSIYLPSWSIRNKDCCRWTGITCDDLTGNVIGLDLGSAAQPYGGIVTTGGEISSSLVRLQHLTHLDLSETSLSVIPEFLGSLSHLKYLNLSYNHFEGTIPYQLGNLSKLETLDISDNSNVLYVDRLGWLSRLSSLKFLSLDSIDFTGAANWLETLKMMPSLTSLTLSSCNFSDHVDLASLASATASNSLKSVNISDNSFHPLVFPWLLNISLNVVNLSMHGNRLTGEIPDSFQNLDYLMHLDLSYNKLEGRIPKSLGNLCSIKMLDMSSNNLAMLFPPFSGNLSRCSKSPLEILKLSHNKLKGPLCDFSSFSSLKELYLDGNHLDGTLPANIFSNLPKLEVLSIGGNKIKGVLPKTMGNLSALRILDVSSNNLSGMISETHFIKLSNLQELYLSYNSFVLNLSNGWIPPFQLNSLGLGSCKVGSHFPAWLHSQKNLTSLDIPDSGISSEIPSWFWNLHPNLVYLNLSSNLMSGEIPDLSLNFERFPAIDLSNNRFHGPIPHFLSNASLLNLSGNMLNGSIPFLCTKTQKLLTFLKLSNNMLSGKLPDCFTRWNNLVILNLANNNFSGRIPTSLGSLTRLRSLRLSNNRFKGALPSSLRKCTKLELLDLGNNTIAESIPVWIGESLANLTVLQLRSNEFNGSFPSSLCHLNSLQILDLSFNNLSGKIPHCIGNLTRMSEKGSSDNLTIAYDYPIRKASWDGRRYIVVIRKYHDFALVVWKGIEHEYNKTLGMLRVIDISSNKLTGEIPNEVTGLLELNTLNLSRNSLAGSIPKKIGQLKALESLDLSRNKLSGGIPDSLAQISRLSSLDVSYNNLSGKIPTGTQLQSFDPSKYAGNTELCGPPLPLTKRCHGDKTEEEIPKTGDDRLHRHGVLSEETSFYIGIAVGFFAGFWGFCGSLVLSSSWRFMFFKFLNDIKDRIFLAIALKMARLRRTSTA